MNLSRAFEQRSQPTFQHVSAEEYTHFVQRYTTNQTRRYQLLRAYGQFTQGYPDLRAWLQVPLAERVGRLYSDSPAYPTYPLSYEARPYLFYLALRGSFQFDWEWLLAVHHLNLNEILSCMRLELGMTKLLDDASRLGYEQRSAGHLR